MKWLREKAWNREVVSLNPDSRWNGIEEKDIYVDQWDTPKYQNKTL